MKVFYGTFQVAATIQVWVEADSIPNAYNKMLNQLDSGIHYRFLDEDPLDNMQFDKYELEDFAEFKNCKSIDISTNDLMNLKDTRNQNAIKTCQVQVFFVA